MQKTGMQKTCRRTVALAVLVALQSAVAGSAALAGGTLAVGKADAKASAIVPVFALRSFTIPASKWLCSTARSIIPFCVSA